MQQKPTIGRNVYFFNELGQAETALVVNVHNDTKVTLKVTNAVGVDHVEHEVLFGEAGQAGRWAWPPKV